MAQNLFKTRYIPNADGSESPTALTNSNCTYVHTYLGDDNTGDGTRQNPYRSASKAKLKGTTYVLFRGLINEYVSFTSAQYLIGDDINQVFLQSNYSPVINRLANLTTDVGVTDVNGYLTYYRVIVTKLLPVSTSFSANFVSNVISLGNLSFGLGFTAGYTAASMTMKSIYMGSANSNYNYIVYKNSICYGLFGLYASSVHKLNYCILTQSVVHKLAGVNIVIPTLTADSKANVQLIRDAFIAAGLSSTFAASSSLFPIDSFGNETCQIVREERDGGVSKNIFNRYGNILTGILSAAITAGSAKTSITLTVVDSSKFPTSGDIFIPNSASYTANGITIASGFEVFTYTSITINSSTSITLNGTSYTFKVAHNNTDTCKLYLGPIDFSLNPDVENVALFGSDVGGYVGAKRPAYDSIQSNMTSIVLVDESTGLDTATAGDLALFNSAGELFYNSSSAQTWNRFRDSVTKYISLGSSFKGGGGDSVDGSPFGYYMGKKQNLIGTTKYYAGDALTVGKWYKVFNDSAISVSNSIVYNSVQYLPEYPFRCITGVTTFSLLNAGTGTYVMEVLADVMESIEIIPYDDANTESAFPKFSCPINGECKLLYYTAAGATRYGKTAGNPVLFADLAVANLITDFGSISNKISYYDNWAISNADQEFFVLGDPSLTSPKSTYFTTAIPNIRYYRRSINAHFDKPYDY